MQMQIKSGHCFASTFIQKLNLDNECHKPMKWQKLVQPNRFLVSS